MASLAHHISQGRGSLNQPRGCVADLGSLPIEQPHQVAQAPVGQAAGQRRQALFQLVARILSRVAETRIGREVIGNELVQPDAEGVRERCRRVQAWNLLPPFDPSEHRRLRNAAPVSELTLSHVAQLTQRTDPSSDVGRGHHAIDGRPGRELDGV